MNPLLHTRDEGTAKIMDFTEWTSSEEGENQKVKAEKVIATIFWDACSIIHIDYLPSKQTINGDYYAALLDCFNNILKKKRPHLVKKKVLFYQDNARIHTCPARMAKFNEFRYELLPHLAYSPDLIPCNYFPFSKKTEEMVRRKEVHH